MQLNLVGTWCCKKNCMEGDALQIVNVVMSPGRNWSQFGQLVADIRGGARFDAHLAD